MSLAFVFPGQGSQAPGMGGDLKTRWPSAAKRLAEAADILGFDLARVCAKGSEEELADTKVAQPAIFTVSYIAWEILAAGGARPNFVSGHSLGEYTACAAAGAFSFADGLKAVKVRAEAMSAAAAKNGGGMLAVMGAKLEDLPGMLGGVKEKGVAAVANYNSPEQVVVTGALPAIEALEGVFKQAGLRVVRLKVSGAFHSPLMQEAADAMRDILAGMEFSEPACPVVGNVTGMVLQSPRLLRDELQSQLISSVRWDACVRTLAGNGVIKAVECGPGRVLSGLIRRNDRSIKCLAAGTAAEIDEAIKEVGGEGNG